MTTAIKPCEAGSVSSGTLRAEDLIDAFSSTLENAVQDNADAWCSDAGRQERDRLLAIVWDAREAHEYDDREDYVQELSEALDLFAPEGHYFGAHWGDGADFGFWPHEDSE